MDVVIRHDNDDARRGAEGVGSLRRCRWWDEIRSPFFDLAFHVLMVELGTLLLCRRGGSWSVAHTQKECLLGSHLKPLVKYGLAYNHPHPPPF